MARTTIREVAARAGVSIGTASLVLTGRPQERRLSDDCVSRVEAAAQDLGYHASYSARSLVRGRSMTLGLVTKFFEHDLFRPGIETGMAAEAHSRGYEILNLSMPEGDKALDRAVQYVQQGRLDGIAVFMGGWTRRSVPAGLSPQVPIVHVWFRAEGFRPVVTLAAGPGIRQAVEHLAGLGHRRVAWLGVRSSECILLPERLAVFRAAAAGAGMEITERFLDQERKAGKGGAGMEAAFYRQFADGMPFLAHTTAAICYNDGMAVALGLALRDKGVEVPQDFSIVGFDDCLAARAVPPLTTISHMLAEMGAAAVRSLDEMVQRDGRRGDDRICVPSQLVIRDSTGPAPRTDGYGDSCA
jgi:LacI family transcriptional regulator